MFEISQETIDSLNESTPGGVIAVKTAVGVCVFRGLRRTEMKRALALSREAATTQDGFEHACRATVVFPALDQFNEALDLKPGIAAICAGKIFELSGLEEGKD